MSIAGGLHLALERGVASGCGAVQIFLKNQRQWVTRPLAAEAVRAFCAAKRRTDLDRHEHIGLGLLGLTPFRALLNDPRLARIPKGIETDKDPEPAADLRNLATLRRLRATETTSRRRGGRGGGRGRSSSVVRRACRRSGRS